jgi:hypothetical protein
MHLSKYLKGTTLRAIHGAGNADVGHDNKGPPANERLILVFDNGRLNIENPFTLKCASNEVVTLSSIVGCHVTDAIITEAEIMIVFEGMIYLCISLQDEDFVGPEAASFTASTGEIVVFN